MEAEVAEVVILWSLNAVTTLILLVKSVPAFEQCTNVDVHRVMTVNYWVLVDFGKY
jgi:hypothetical protein